MFSASDAYASFDAFFVRLFFYPLGVFFDVLNRARESPIQSFRVKKRETTWADTKRQAVCPTPLATQELWLSEGYP
jgi:hypothetical protein